MIIPKQNILIKKSLFHNLQEYKDNNYPDSIFYHKNGNIYFELDLKNNYLWCDYDMVWNVFSNNNELDYSETQCVIKNMVEQYTNWGSVTPCTTPPWW